MRIKDAGANKHERPGIEKGETRGVWNAEKGGNARWSRPRKGEESPIGYDLSLKWVMSKYLKYTSLKMIGWSFWTNLCKWELEVLKIAGYMFDWKWAPLLCSRSARKLSSLVFRLNVIKSYIFLFKKLGTHAVIWVWLQKKLRTSPAQRPILRKISNFNLN